MRWLPSSTSRYLILGVSLLAVLAVMDSLVRTVVTFGSFGFALTLWACFGVVYAWLLLEPMVSAAMVLRKVRDQDVLDRITCLVEQVSKGCGILTPNICVYQDNQFDVVTVGIGNRITIFISSALAKLDDTEFKAVIAHECGHIHLGHSVTRLFMYGSLLTMAMISNNTPLVVMLANLFVLWAMRQMEYAADGVAAKTVGDEGIKGALIFFQSMLGDIPKWQTFFSTHPRFAQRIKRLE